MKKFKLFILAFLGCIALAACGGGDDNDDVVEPYVSNIHNGTSTKPAYSPAR